MRQKELLEKEPNLKTFLGEMEVNPLQVFENFFFEVSQTEQSKDDYRNKAIQNCLDKKYQFFSTRNTTGRLLEKFILVICPKCGKTISGKSHERAQTTEYTCLDCNISLRIKAAISVIFLK